MTKSLHHQSGFDSLRYQASSELILSLNLVHRRAGLIDGMRWSPFGLRRLQIEADKQRIMKLVQSAGASASCAEIDTVVAGGVLPRRCNLGAIRRAVLLCHVVREAAAKGNATAPETVAVYFGLVNGTDARVATLWSRYVERHRDGMLTLSSARVETQPEVSRIYEWMDADPLLSEEPILRAACLYRELSGLHPQPGTKPAILAVVDHELRAKKLGLPVLFVLGDRKASGRFLSPPPPERSDSRADDLTRLFEGFSLEIADALGERWKQLCKQQDDEQRLPGLMARPPDELDREIFDVIEKVGNTRCGDLRDMLNDPPPTRTIQRRLKRLVGDGLIVKRGARKDAYYVIAGQVV
jgi:hypothetical protein